MGGAAIALLMAMTLVFAVQSPASAHETWSCAHGIGCIYTNSGGGGTKVNLPSSVYTPYTCYNLTGSLNDAVSSAVADYGSGYDLTLYEDAGCTGSGFDGSHTLHTPGSVSYTGLKAWFNDRASSFIIGVAS